jgi:hypothetical protein
MDVSVQEQIRLTTLQLWGLTNLLFYLREVIPQDLVLLWERFLLAQYRIILYSSMNRTSHLLIGSAHSCGRRSG